MAWLNNFLIGRPNAEISFSINPNSMKITDEQLVAANRVLSGRRKKWVFCTSIPTIQISSRFMLLADVNSFDSLLTITDTPLSFRVRSGDFQIIDEIDSPISTANVNIQQNSATRLSAQLVGVGGPSVITVTAVRTAPGGSGTNYFTGGAYNDQVYAVTLGTPLPALSSVYVTYNYSGWLVHVDKLPMSIQGGWIDKFEYQGWELIAA